MSAVVDCDPGEVCGWDEQAFFRESLLVCEPGQGHEERALRWGERRLQDGNAGFAVRFGRHCGLDLKADKTSRGVVTDEHLDHLQVWKRPEEVKVGILCKSADHLRLAKESQPVRVPIDRLCLELVRLLKPGDERLRTHQTLRQLLARYQIWSPVASRRSHAEGSRIDILATDRTSRSQIL